MNPSSWRELCEESRLVVARALREGKVHYPTIKQELPAFPQSELPKELRRKTGHVFECRMCGNTWNDGKGLCPKCMSPYFRGIRITSAGAIPSSSAP